jgi:hypothetical protein
VSSIFCIIQWLVIARKTGLRFFQFKNLFWLKTSRKHDKHIDKSIIEKGFEKPKPKNTFMIRFTFLGKKKKTKHIARWNSLMKWNPLTCISTFLMIGIVFIDHFLSLHCNSTSSLYHLVKKKTFISKLIFLQLITNLLPLQTPRTNAEF